MPDPASKPTPRPTRTREHGRNLNRPINQPPPAIPIRTDEVYRLSEVARRMGWGRYAMSTARRAGLPVRRLGRRSFVCGDELIEWLKAVAKRV